MYSRASTSYCTEELSYFTKTWSRSIRFWAHGVFEAMKSFMILPKFRITDFAGTCFLVSNSWKAFTTLATSCAFLTFYEDVELKILSFLFCSIKSWIAAWHSCYTVINMYSGISGGAMTDASNWPQMLAMSSFLTDIDESEIYSIRNWSSASHHDATSVSADLKDLNRS